MKIDIELEGSVEHAVSRLESAIRAQAPTSVLDHLRPRLAGDVSAHEVTLFRRRGPSSWYGVFRGQFERDGSHARLTGSFLRSSSHFMSAWAGFAVLWGLILAGAVIRRWQGAESIAWLVAALLAIAAGLLTVWLRAKNTRAEAELLSEELAAILGKHGA